MNTIEPQKCIMYQAYVGRLKDTGEHVPVIRGRRGLVEHLVVSLINVANPLRRVVRRCICRGFRCHLLKEWLLKMTERRIQSYR